jgi:hypothetical protein
MAKTEAEWLEQAVGHLTPARLNSILARYGRKRGAVTSRIVSRVVTEIRRVKFQDGSIAIYHRSPGEAHWGLVCGEGQAEYLVEQERVEFSTVIRCFAGFEDGTAVTYERPLGSQSWSKVEQEPDAQIDPAALARLRQVLANI